MIWYVAPPTWLTAQPLSLLFYAWHGPTWTESMSLLWKLVMFVVFGKSLQSSCNCQSVVCRFWDTWPDSWCSLCMQRILDHTRMHVCSSPLASWSRQPMSLSWVQTPSAMIKVVSQTQQPHSHAKLCTRQTRLSTRHEWPTLQFLPFITSLRSMAAWYDTTLAAILNQSSGCCVDKHQRRFLFSQNVPINS